MKKRVLGIILSISGIFGFMLLLGGVGCIEVSTTDYFKGVFTSLAGIIILVIIIFLGIPYFEKIESSKKT